MAEKRKVISQKLRFEVFKRDKFTCQYCGAKAPDVVLQVDHIEAVAAGGGNDILNLLTSCIACNGGKGARALSDDSVVERQRAQLAELEERRQQIEMMVQWKTELTSQDDTLVIALEAEIEKRTGGWHYSEGGRARAREAIRKHGFPAMFDSVGIAVSQYGHFNDAGKLTEGSAAHVLGMIPRIAANRVRYGNDPDDSKLVYIQAILRRRLDEPDLTLMRELRAFRAAGLSITLLQNEARAADSEYEFLNACRTEAERIKACRDAGIDP